MRAATTYDVLTLDGTEQVIQVRPSHWLALERTVPSAGGFGQLEQVLRVIHIASDDDGDFDAWVDTLASWTRSDLEGEDDEGGDDAARPTETQPKPSPA